MGDMVTLQMLVDKVLADELIEKDFAEVAFRRADAKFRQMVKCKLAGTPVAAEASPELLESMYNSISNHSFQMRDVRHAMYSLNNSADKMLSAVRNMSVQLDNIYQMNGMIMNMSYLNAGISMANMAVDIAGFVVVTNKLNDLHYEVQQMSGNIQKIATIQTNEKLADCLNLIMRCNSMSDKLKRNDVNMDDLDILITDIRSYLYEMQKDLHDKALGEEMVLKIIYTLLPAYTSFLGEYLKRYYLLYREKPANYDIFMSLYDELDSSNYYTRLSDYYFLEQDIHAPAVEDIIGAHKLIGLNGRTQIEDQMSIFEQLKDREKILLFEKNIEEFAEKRMMEFEPSYTV